MCRECKELVGFSYHGHDDFWLDVPNGASIDRHDRCNVDPELSTFNYE